MLSRIGYAFFQAIQWCSWRVIHWPPLCTLRLSASSSPFLWVKKCGASGIGSVGKVKGKQLPQHSWCPSTRLHLRPSFSFECWGCQRSQLEGGAGVRDDVILLQKNVGLSLIETRRNWAKFFGNHVATLLPDCMVGLNKEKMVCTCGCLMWISWSYFRKNHSIIILRFEFRV